MKRRDFLAACAAGGLAGLAGCAPRQPPLPPGELRGADFGLGHRLAAGDFPAPAETRQTELLIIGAGIAGLSAAWRLERAGFTDYRLLELEQAPGGNSRHGENPVSAHPYGAHYLPLPGPEARAVRLLLADLGVLRGDPMAAEPDYDEAYLCHAPQERLYRLGVWQEGVVPHLGLGRAELDQQERFFAEMAAFREVRDRQGRRAFALPLELASPAPVWTALDRLSFHDWMRSRGYDAPSLHWYANYACRDDYGTDYRQVSAWAGIHYFACRNGAGRHAAGDAVLTAPEGNGWIVKRLAARAGARLETGSAVYRLEQDGQGVTALVLQSGRSIRYRARQAIWAAPLFLLPRLAPGLPGPLAAAIAPIDYAPWLVASLTVDGAPAAGAGAALAWDNVLYDSPGLGYVVATHQQIRRVPGPTVLSYYLPLSGADPRAERARLLNTPREAWARDILADLGRAHPDLGRQVRRLDLFRHGHAMARPRPGLLHDGRRQVLARGWGRLRLAHADISGISLFEEANYWGVRAAESCLAQAGGTLKERLV